MPKLFQLSSTHWKARKMLNMCAKDVAKKTCIVRFCYNYAQCGQSKLNALMPEDEEYIFITTQTGFSVKFLQYHDALQFRGFLSNMAIHWAQDEVMELSPDHQRSRYAQSYASARLLWNAMTEFSAMWFRETQQSLVQKIQSIDIEDPVKESLMVNYQAWWQTSVMTKKERDRLTVVAMDGYEKIATKCAGEPPSKGGRPRKDGQIRHFNNGWFISPDTGLILLIVEMRNPEDNAIALFCLEKIVGRTPPRNARRPLRIEGARPRLWLCPRRSRERH